MRNSLFSPQIETETRRSAKRTSPSPPNMAEETKSPAPAAAPALTAAPADVGKPGQNFVDSEKSASASCFDGDYPRFQILKKLGLDVCALDGDGRTLFHWCCAGAKSQRMMEEVYEEMLAGWDRKGKMVDHRDEDGWTALCSAVSAGHLDVVKFLLEKGADPNVKTNQMRHALFYVKGNEEVLECLLPHINNVDHRDKAGATALSRCAALGSEGCVRLLLQYGATADIKDTSGDNAAHVAANAHHFDLALLLKAQLSDPNAKAANGRTVDELVEKGRQVKPFDFD